MEKNHVGKRIAFASLLTTTAVVFIPLFHHQTEAIQAIQSLLPSGLDCGRNLTPQTADGVLVPGAGMEVDPLGTFAPNRAQKARLTAAIYEYVQNPALRIFLLNGPPDKKDKNKGNSVVEFLQQEYQRITHSKDRIPTSRIIIDAQSYNTASNMREAAILARHYGASKFILVTDHSHTRRAELFACNYGLKTTPYSSESLRAKFEFPQNGVVYSRTPLSTWVKEYGEIVLAYGDPKGSIPMNAKRLYQQGLSLLEKSSLSISKKNNEAYPKSYPKTKDIWQEQNPLRKRNRFKVVFSRKRYQKPF